MRAFAEISRKFDLNVVKSTIEEKEEAEVFKINIDGFNIRLRIKGYDPRPHEDGETGWCRCDWQFYSDDWQLCHLCYMKDDDEILLSSEVAALEEYLTQLLNDEITEKREVEFAEPDFTFVLYPRSGLRESSKGGEGKISYEWDADILMEWRVNLWDGDGCLTANYFSVTFEREEIILLRDYLSSVING